MKNRKLHIGLLFAIIINFTSCKNDLKVLAPGKESVSVYGILNPNEAIQNIRINKVYLTDGDALASGQDVNQINYGPGELTVTLQRFMPGSSTPIVTTVGNLKKQIVLTETVVTTQSGSFNQNQRIWQTSDKLYSSGEYKLTIKNNSTGAEFTSQNTIIDSVKSSNSMPFIYTTNPKLYPMHGNYIPDQPPGFGTPKVAYVDYSTLNINQKIKFVSIPNAKLYSVIMRFHYIDSLVGGGTNFNYVDYNFPTIESNTLAGSEALSVSFTANDFYVNAGQIISRRSVPNLKNRRAYYLEYIVQAGSESLSEFLQVNAPSTTIAQDKPYYTNIIGGVGIFSSSSTTTITKDLWNDFIDKIACHPSTYPLLFCNSGGAPVALPCN